MIEGKEQTTREETVIERVVTHSTELRNFAYQVSMQLGTRVSRILGPQCEGKDCCESPEPCTDMEKIQSNFVEIRRALEAINENAERL